MSEHTLQLHATAFLEASMPAEIPWTAVDHAAKLSPRQAGERKRRGVKRGQADYRFVLPPLGLSAEIELKLEGSYQSPEQKAWEAKIKSAGGRYQVCRSLKDIQETLEQWGVRLRAKLT